MLTRAFAYLPRGHLRSVVPRSALERLALFESRYQIDFYNASYYYSAVRRRSLADADCPVARSLDVIGEWWSLLIIRDALLGARRFDEFKTRSTIKDNVLSARLKKLVENGVLDRQLYQEHPARYEYRLTNKGRELAPIIAALRVWGGQWTSGQDLSPRLVHKDCGHDVQIALACGHCARRVTVEEIQPCAGGEPFRNPLPG